MRRALAGALWFALAAAPRVAAACSVCSAGKDDKTQYAFLIGSIFLSVLPPAVVGGVAYWVWRRAKQIAADEAAGVIHLPERRLPAVRVEGGARWADAARSTASVSRLQAAPPPV